MLAQWFLQLTLVAADGAASHQGMLTQLFLKLTLVGAEWVLWLLVLLSFVSVGIIVDRVWYFMEHRVDVADLAAKLEQFLRQGDLKSAWQLVAGSDAIECVVVAAGLAAVTRGTSACSEAMLSAKGAPARDWKRAWRSSEPLVPTPRLLGCWELCWGL